MTIVPPHHTLSNDQEQLLRILDKGAGGGLGSYPSGHDSYHGIDSGLEKVNPTMAEDDLTLSRCHKPNDQEMSSSVSASGSKGFHGPDEDEGWLQLSIGGSTGWDRNGGNKSGDGRDRSVSAARGSLELDLQPPGRSSSASINKLEVASSSTSPKIGLTIATSSSPPLLFQHQHGSSSGFGSEFPYQHPETINWGFRPIFLGQGIVGGAIPRMWSNSSYPSSSSSLSMPYATPYVGWPFQLQIGGAVTDHRAGPSTDAIKIIDPPRRRHSSIWFMLLASQNQDREPFLPQIPKSYLRIKDGRMTVRLLTKYLVNKLKLDSELEVEITCRGQDLQHDFTLQHVRDNIWSSSPRKDSSSSSSTSVPVVTLLPDSSTIQHLMVLHYSRRRNIAKTTPTTTTSPS